MSVHSDRSPEYHAGGMYQFKYQQNTDWLKMLPISRCESTRKRQKLKDEGQSMDQDDAATKSSKMLSIKRGGSCPHGTGKWQKIRAQLDMSLQMGETSTRPITRALSQKQELKSQDDAKIFNLDDSSFMGGSCTKIISEDETLKRCPPVDIIEIDSSDENSGLHSNLDGLINDNSDFISRAIVKDELSDTNENDQRLGSLEIGLNGEQPVEVQPEKGQSQLNVSEHANICSQVQGDSLTVVIRDSSHILPITTSKQGNTTKESLRIDHTLGSPNRGGLTLRGQSMDPKPEEGQSESIASQHENECPGQERQTHFNESNHGFGSSNKICSTFEGQLANQQLEGGESQSIASQHENDCLKVSGSTAISMDLSHIMQAILNKYGDITKACTLQSELFKTLCLEGICKVVQKLQDTHLADMKSDDVKGFYSILRDAESLNFDVKWLHQRLYEIVKAVTSKDELKKLEDELRASKVKAEEISNALELKTIEQAKLEHDIEKLEEQNVIESIKIEELNAQIDNIKSTCLSFEQVMPNLL